MEIYASLITRADDGLAEQVVEALEEDFDLEQVDYLPRNMLQIQITGGDNLMEELPEALNTLATLVDAPVICILWGDDDPFYKLCQQNGDEYQQWQLEEPAFDWLQEDEDAFNALPKAEQAAIEQGLEAWADYCFDVWLAPFKGKIDEARLREEIFIGF